MSDAMDSDVREVIRRRIALRERDGHERLLLNHEALRALLDAADERDRLLTVADTLGRVNGEYAMEIRRCREALGVEEDTDPHHAAQALAAAVEHWHLACIGESIRVGELEAELADGGSQCNR